MLDAAGAILLRMSLKIYRGTALIATITATFHAKGTVTTKVKSTKDKRIEVVGRKKILTEILWKERNANNIEEQGDNLRSDHINMP